MKNSSIRLFDHISTVKAADVAPSLSYIKNDFKYYNYLYYKDLYFPIESPIN